MDNGRAEKSDKIISSGYFKNNAQLLNTLQSQKNIADNRNKHLLNEKKNIQVENLPEHEHDLRGPSGDQYYVIRDIQGVPTDPEGIQYDAPTGSQAGQAYPTSGGILTNDAVGEPLDVMQPFTTMNYIIYTGVGG